MSLPALVSDSSQGQWEVVIIASKFGDWKIVVGTGLFGGMAHATRDSHIRDKRI